MTPNPVVLDPALSYVVQVGGRVRLRLRLHLATLATVTPMTAAGGSDPGARAKLVKAGRSKVGDAVISATRDGSMFEAILPPGRLARGVWELQISLQRGARFESTGARVLIADPNPIALLVGPVPQSAVPSPRHTVARRQRVAMALGTVADRALRELPPEPAAKTRVVLRRAARKVSAALSR